MLGEVNKFIMMSDILRTSSREIYYTDRVCASLYQLLNKQISLAIGKELELEIGINSKIFDREVFYKLAGYDCVSEENYIKIAAGKIAQDAIQYFKDCFNSYFIIFNEAGSLKQVVDAADIPYLDFVISSVRFCDDLNFAFRSNILEITNQLLKYRTSKDYFTLCANKVKSYYYARKCYDNVLKPNSLLLCGQTEVDLSLIKDGKLVSFIDFKDDLEKLIKSYTKVYYKRHPHAIKGTESEKFICSFDNVQYVDDNFYKLLSCGEITDVAALSSGTLTEAEYFNKNVHYISHRFMNYCTDDKPNKGEFIIIDQKYYFSDFWADILSPITSTNGAIKLGYSDMPANYLRANLNCWWGYEAGKSTTDNSGSQVFGRGHLKEIKTFEVLPQYNKITSKDISVVVQGGVQNKNEVRSCLKSIRKYLPEAEIILSTWQGADVEGLDYDDLILSADPGVPDLMLVTDKKNNVNRQIISTKKGVDSSSRKYTLKLRTDCKLSGIKFLKYANQLLKNPLKKEKDYNYFQERIMISSHFTRNPNLLGKSGLALCFHPSDIWLFGLTEDIKKLFDIPLQAKFITEIRGRQYQWRCPEQHIWMSFLEKQGLYISSDSMHYNDTYTRELTNRSIINNFFILNNKETNIVLPEKFRKYNQKTFEAIFETQDYLQLYKHLYDIDYIIPLKFRYKTIMEMLGINNYYTKLGNKLSQFRYIYEIPSLVFKILMKVILNSYKLLWWII